MLTRVLPSHGPGGMAAAAWDLATAFDRAGAQVEVLTTAGGKGGDAAPGVTVRALEAPAGRYSAAWWRESARAYREVAKVDVVLGVSAAANAVAALPRAGRPAFVFQAHGTSLGEAASKLRAPRLRTCAGVARNVYWGLARDRAYRDFDAVAPVGEAVRRQLQAWPTSALVGRTPVRLIRNGVDVGAFRFDPVARAERRARLGITGAAPLVLFAGRLQADKEPLRALEAVRAALGARPDLQFLLIGDGPERAALERRIGKLGLEGRTRLLGAVDRAEMAGWLSAADALLLPTVREEGLPLVVLEALASGLPVLTTPQGARDAELPCERFEAADVGGFADALARLPAPTPRVSRLPDAFHLEHAAGAYLRLFEKLLAAPAAQVA